MIAVAVFLINESMVFPGWWALLPCCGTFLVVSAGPNAWLRNRRVLSNRLLVGIGLMSYPLYLWHWPLLSFARITKATASGGCGLGLSLSGWRPCLVDYGLSKSRSVSALKEAESTSCFVYA